MREAVIVAAVRTPVGRHGGALASVRPDDLGAVALKALLERSGVQASEITDVVFGCANQAGEDNRNVGRMATLLAGYGEGVPATTINRLCGSSLDAINQATKGVLSGEGEVFVAGGVESMSRAPWVMPKAEKAFATGNVQMYDTTIGWRFINPKMKELYGVDSMGETAENLAVQYNIPRSLQDEFAVHSQQKAVKAMQSGVFDSQIVPVEIKGRKGTIQVTTDENPRAETTLEGLAALKPAFKSGGTVTAGNSSSLNDGAAALMITSKEYAVAHGLPILAKVKSWAVAGVPPRIMGIGPVAAVNKALSRVGMSLNDIEAIELNEAFAAQALAVLHDLKVDPFDHRLNMTGGAIALGHPLGASGARIMTTLLYNMQQRNLSTGLATMCIGVGQGIATVVERV